VLRLPAPRALLIQAAEDDKWSRGAQAGRIDPPLEGDGFELSVPREIGYGFGDFGPFSGAFESPVGRDPSPNGTHPLATRN
jgi:hypothetical protein